MSEFDTIPASPQSEEPKGEPEIKEEKKQKIEVEDWGAEPPAPEPEFVKSGDDAARNSERPLPVETEQMISGNEHPEIVAIETSEPVHTAAEPKPEVIDTPAYKPQGAGEPPKKNNTWWIILIAVLLLLCVCCVIAVAVFTVIGMVDDGYITLIQSALPI